MKLVDALRRSLQEIVTNHAAFGREELEPPYVSLRRINIEDAPFSISLTETGLELLAALTLEIFKERPALRELYSEEHVADLVLDSLVYLGAESQKRDFGKSAVELLAALPETRARWYVVTGVENLRLTKGVTIADVELFPAVTASSEPVFSKVRGRTDAPVDADTFEHFVQSQKPSALATVEVWAAEETKAIQKALSRIDLTLDLIRLLEPWAAFGITGYHIEGTHALVCVGIDRSLLVESYEPVSEMWPGTVTSEVEGMMKTDRRLQRLQEIVMKDQRSDMEGRLVRALEWFGKGVQQREARDRILSCWIALETLLLRPGEPGKAEALSERAAFLLAGDLDHRRNVFERGLAAGKTRNSVTHRGELQVTEQDADGCTLLAKDVILAIAGIVDQATTIDALKKFLDLQKFA